MHVAITGASGYVGRALARQLQVDAQLGGRAIARLTLLDLAFDDAPVASFVRRRAGAKRCGANRVATNNEPSDVR